MWPCRLWVTQEAKADAPASIACLAYLAAGGNAAACGGGQQCRHLLPPSLFLPLSSFPPSSFPLFSISEATREASAPNQLAPPCLAPTATSILSRASNGCEGGEADGRIWPPKVQIRRVSGEIWASLQRERPDPLLQRWLAAVAMAMVPRRTTRFGPTRSRSGASTR